MTTRVLSARVDEQCADELDRLARHLGLTKRQLLEEAIRMRAAASADDSREDVWAETSGAWSRRESPATTVRRSRRAFQRSLTRHQVRHARVRR